MERIIYSRRLMMMALVIDVYLPLDCRPAIECTHVWLAKVGLVGNNVTQNVTRA